MAERLEQAVQEELSLALLVAGQMLVPVGNEALEGLAKGVWWRIGGHGCQFNAQLADPPQRN